MLGFGFGFGVESNRDQSTGVKSCRVEWRSSRVESSGVESGRGASNRVESGQR